MVDSVRGSHDQVSSSQRPVHGAFVGDGKQRCVLTARQVAAQPNGSGEHIDPGRSLVTGLAVCAMVAVMAERVNDFETVTFGL
jgi:hypothetical protein